MGKKKFSIIMPCFNSDRFVKNAIDSVIEQQYRNWELIAVNDGSTDDTLNILNYYASCDKRIQVISKDNGGYSSAINCGIDHISGDYFLMMGSDDRLCPELFQSIIDELYNKSPDIIAFRTVRYKNGVSKGIDSTTNFKNKAYLQNASVAKYVVDYPEQAKILFVRDTSKCYKTALLGDLRLFGKFGYDADGIFATLFAHKARSFMSVPVDGYMWTLRSDSLSATTNLQVNLDRLANWKKFFELIKTLPIDEITKYDTIYAEHYTNLAQSTALMIQKNDFESISLLKQNIECIPEILERYNLENGIKSKMNLLLLTKFTRFWIYYRRIRLFLK